MKLPNRKGAIKLKKNVLVLLPVEARHQKKLEAAGAGCTFVYSSPDEVSAGQIGAANIIIGQPNADRLQASENARKTRMGKDISQVGVAVAWDAGKEHMFYCEVFL